MYWLQRQNSWTSWRNQSLNCTETTPQTRPSRRFLPKRLPYRRLVSMNLLLHHRIQWIQSVQPGVPVSSDGGDPVKEDTVDNNDSKVDLDCPDDLV